MDNTLKIRLAARCEAAGRSENEDNYQVAEDLSKSNKGFTTDKIIPLGSKGTLLLVCDGMGGMNAGEVASAVGVETIKNLFSPSMLTAEVMQNDDSICAYIKRAIVRADANIKEDAAKDQAKQGMGSTAVLAWLLGRKVYVGWCGDSRAYRYNPKVGLEQLSHDHSYVQDLVDTGKLDADLAFDHPQKNIITRSLGDPRGVARPDVKVYDLRLGDIIMLCSDGLSDSLRDEEIAKSMHKGISSMEVCRDALWEDSRSAGWHDNVTIVLCQVVDENAVVEKKPVVVPQQQRTDNRKPKLEQCTMSHETGKGRTKNPNIKKYLIGACIFIAIVFVAFFVLNKVKEKKEKEEKIEQLCKKIPKELSFDASESENVLANGVKEYITTCNEIMLLDPEKGEEKAKLIEDAIDRVALILAIDYCDESKANALKELKKQIKRDNQ